MSGISHVVTASVHLSDYQLALLLRIAPSTPKADELHVELL